MGLKRRSSGCFLFSIGAGLFLQTIPIAPAAAGSEMVAASKADAAWQRRQQTPVAWRITRARFKGASGLTQTESFRENWTVEYLPQGVCVITSPHASVQATVVATKANINSLISVSETALARLLGVASTPSQESASESKPPRYINLQFLRPNSHLVDDVTLNLSDEEHLAVHFEVGI